MELINGSYEALEKDFLLYFSQIKKEPLEKVLIITQSKRLEQRLKEKLLSYKECLSCVFWQDILGLVSSINRASKTYIPLRQKNALTYFKFKNFLQEHNFNSSAAYIKALESSFMDMQNANILPQDLGKIAEFKASLSSQDLKDLIFIYKNYLTLSTQEQTLSYKDFFAAALENIENNSYLNQFKKIIFYGIYDFTSLQYDILKAVGQNYPTALFFPYENIAAYKYIQDFYLANIIGIASEHKKLPDAKSSLQDFASHLFEVPKEQDKPQTFNPDIQIINTSGAASEVAFAAKAVLNLHKQGFAFKDIAVCARSLEPYKDTITKVFEQNSIPVNINFEESFLSYPLISVCYNLLNVVRNNFHKDSVLSFISSPYLKNRQKSWGKLIKDIGVQTGFNQWLSLLESAIENKKNDAASLKEFLCELQSKISALEESSSFSLLVLKVKEIFDTFLDSENINTEEKQLFIRLENILKEISTFDKVRFAKPGEFLDELNYFIEKEKTNFVINLQNALTIADIMNLRGQTFKAVIVLGLNEGLFPSSISEDPVFKDSWRAALQNLGYNINLSVQRYWEEKLFFYFALSAARQKAILIYQRCDEDGKIKIPSLYLNWVLKLAGEIKNFSVSRRPAEQLIELYKISPDLLTPQEAALLSALEGNFNLAASLLEKEDRETFLQAYNLGSASVLGARDMVMKSENRLWQHIAEKGLSPSALSNLFQCPAKYFFENILDREDTSSLQRDMLDSREKGTLFHKILEEFYCHLVKNNLFDKLFAQGQNQGISNILQPFIENNLKESYYKKYGLYPLLWLLTCRAMREELQNFVQKDIARLQAQKQIPAYFEKDIACRIGSLKIHGKIDRVDISQNKTSFNVIDYKSGKIESKGSKIIFKEANMQAPFYFELAKYIEELKNSEPDKMIYALLKKAAFKEISYTEYLTFKETFWALANFLENLAKEGLFIITPGEQACRYCAYGDICRKNHEPTRRRAFFSAQAGKLREYRAK